MKGDIESRRKDKEGQYSMEKGREYIRQGEDISCLQIALYAFTYVETCSTTGNVDREGITGNF